MIFTLTSNSNSNSTQRDCIVQREHFTKEGVIYGEQFKRNRHCYPDRDLTVSVREIAGLTKFIFTVGVMLRGAGNLLLAQSLERWRRSRHLAQNIDKSSLVKLHRPFRQSHLLTGKMYWFQLPIWYHTSARQWLHCPRLWQAGSETNFV